MNKWEEQVQSEDILKRVTAKRFIEIFREAELIKGVDIDLFFKVLEKITVYDDSLIVRLLDGSDVEWKIK